MEGEVDAFGGRVELDGLVPVGLDGEALEDGDEEDGDALQGVEDVEEVDGPADADVLLDQAQQEEEHRRLDQGQDGVVEELGEVEPPQAGLGVELGDVLLVPAKVVEFDVWASRLEGSRILGACMTYRDRKEAA